MNNQMKIAAVAGAVLCFGAASSAQEISTAKDLTAVIALQGLPCGQVTTTAKQGDNDYLATCQDGNRYHVFINAQGRVVVEKQ